MIGVFEMIRIKEWKTKKTKVHVTYEFDHDGKNYVKTTTFAIKDFTEINKQTLYPRIRGRVNSERLKLSRPSEKVEETEEE